MKASDTVLLVSLETIHPVSHVEAIAKAAKRYQQTRDHAWFRVWNRGLQTAKWCVSWETTMRRRDHRDPVELAELHRVLFF